jgi:4-hydroxybenzoate polyprenyltransferase
MKKYFSLVKFAHTIFALPFAILGFFLGLQFEEKIMDWRVFGLVLLCMVFARSAAMAFNRYLDRDIDAVNPRTARREIPAGLVSPRAALIFVIINALLFILTTWFINPLCFALSPVALLVVLGYSYTKRFTALCHFVLGLGLSLAPIGAFLSVTGYFHWLPIMYSLVVLFWVSGFDIIYALQDEDFDKENKLKSVPTWLGKKRSLNLSFFLHFLCGSILLGASYAVWVAYPGFEYIHWLGAMVFLVLLFYQHTLVKPHDLSKVNLAFFTTNGLASLIFGALFVLDFFV